MTKSKAYIKYTEYYLPAKVVGNSTIAKYSDTLTASKIEEKTGICVRHVAGPDEYSSDLASKACEKLFKKYPNLRDEVQFLIVCTQTPDYLIPTTACIIQSKIQLKNTVGSFDVNLGCSGFIYSLSIASGLIGSGQVKNVLIVTVDTYSKYISHDNASVRTIFGDAATATYIDSVNSEECFMGGFSFGTDGDGWDKLIVKNSGLKKTNKKQTAELYMDGPAIFSFTLKTVPRLVEELQSSAFLDKGEVGYYIFHQANKFMLEKLRDKVGINPKRFYLDLHSTGNTVSSSIPIAICDAMKSGLIKKNTIVALLGFGVGYSWAGCLFRYI